MRLEFFDPALKAIFGYSDHLQADLPFFSEQEGLVYILWNRNEEPVTYEIDGLVMSLAPQHITTATYLHRLDFAKTSLPLTGFLFNRAFYCIIDHDAEVSCNGLLFLGAHDLPFLTLDKVYLRKIDLLTQVIVDEFKTVDNIQGEMLQMLLKRLVIICTRLAKDQMATQPLEAQQVESIRQFNILVDTHFRKLHQVKDYAALLHKSPKTLSNLFSSYSQRTPQQIIQERVVLEAKRLMMYTDKQNQEIAYELGFEDPAYFSRYFKKIAGVSPTRFRAEKATFS